MNLRSLGLLAFALHSYSPKRFFLTAESRQHLLSKWDTRSTGRSFGIRFLPAFSPQSPPCTRCSLTTFLHVSGSSGFGSSTSLHVFAPLLLILEMLCTQALPFSMYLENPWFSCQVESDSHDPMDCSLPGSPWDFPGKNTGVVCHFPLQGIFLNQGSNPGLLHCRQFLKGCV